MSGEIKGDETNVVALVPGQVEWVAVSEGDSIDQGEVLAQLSSDELQTQLEAIQLSIENLNRAILPGQTVGGEITF
ncbi:MAG: biotin/lipoyl-binding protein [Leptolyngbyaceae cyanobacterium RM1_406_9]|nr:biotin/lipoyl-binding protein [Leptolyngbyaceae cyanobacterium RM1_406_9]